MLLLPIPDEKRCINIKQQYEKNIFLNSNGFALPLSHGLRRLCHQWR